TSELLNILEGDGEVVNVVQGHPYEPMLAVSGIDHSIKVFSADKRARRDARLGRGISAVDSEGFSSIEWGRSRRSGGGARRRSTRSLAGGEDESTPLRSSTFQTADNENGEEDSDDPDEAGPAAPNGLASRKRMQDEYQITSQNDADRRGGMRAEGTFSADIMALIAGRIRAQMAGGGGEGIVIGGPGGLGGLALAGMGQGEGEEGEEGCVVQ
ncbi:hypothetical protein LTS18_001891, partial [Coniosporium uncinatum]